MLKKLSALKSIEEGNAAIYSLKEEKLTQQTKVKIVAFLSVKVQILHG